ncbi:MAG: FtsQ-type POTRA domain-containing protein [Candidatus Aureabacteria bacterium]|nr:FtsQ-type POTRA domain-containing protein [Candidatus Auribacterota bacterium]
MLELKTALSEKRNRFRARSRDWYHIKNVDIASKMLSNKESRLDQCLAFFWKGIFWIEQLFLIAAYTVVFYGVEIFCENVFAQTLQERCFSIQKITIDHILLVKEEEIMEAIQLRTDADIITCDLDEMRRKIEKIPNVREAIVKRVFPGKLEIDVHERIPVFRMSMPECLIDEEGKEVQLENGYHIYRHLPVLGGFSINRMREIPLKNIKRYKEVLKLIKAFTQKFRGVPLEVKKVISGEEWVDFFMPNGTRIRFPAENAEEKFDRFSLVWKDMAKKKRTANTIDLQFKDVVVSI